MAPGEVPPIPERLAAAIVFLRGDEDGRAWLEALPGRITRYARRWELVPQEIAEGGAMSCCVLCLTRDRRQVVLKIPVDATSGRQEVRLLEKWSGSGATPAVLHTANGSGVFVMSRITPGTTAWAIGDFEDSRRFGGLLTRLHATAHPTPVKDLAEVMELRLDWARGRFADPRYANDVASIPAAERVLEVLLRTTKTRQLLHADLQAKNVLLGPGGRWFAIDPLGAVGDMNAEAALWVAIQDGPTDIAGRLAELADHPLLDPVRLKAWTYVFAIAEYRPYLPRPATRIARFLSRTPTEEILDPLS